MEYDQEITDPRMREADLVIINGIIVKNREGRLGTQERFLPDGFYRVERLELPGE